MKNTIQIKNAKCLITIDYMIANILRNKKLKSVVSELFIRGRKLNIFYYAIISFFIRKYYTKFYILFLYEKSQSHKFNKLHLIIYWILTLETLWIFTKNVLQNHIFYSAWYYSFMKESFKKNIKTNYNNWW